MRVCAEEGRATHPEVAEGQLMDRGEAGLARSRCPLRIPGSLREGRTKQMSRWDGPQTGSEASWEPPQVQNRREADEGWCLREKHRTASSEQKGVGPSCLGHGCMGHMNTPPAKGYPNRKAGPSFATQTSQSPLWVSVFFFIKCGGGDRAGVDSKSWGFMRSGILLSSSFPRHLSPILAHLQNSLKALGRRL